ncbi:MAG: hypothetical protein WKF43_12245 [Acidimicrobiales bacterium]
MRRWWTATRYRLGADLDHIAVAAERQADLWPRYGGDLGGVWVGGDRTIGFASAQVRFTGAGRSGEGARLGTKLEVLEPNEVDGNDFLRRFLDRSGPGPHHLTFKVRDIRLAIAIARRRGLSPVGIDLSDPDWMEAFLHPKEACGIVVQLAQSRAEWQPGPSPLPAPRVARPAVLARVDLLVAELGVATALFQSMLGGHASSSTLSTSTGGGPRGSPGGHTDVSWPGGGRIRLAQPGLGSEAAEWLGDRPGRVDSLFFRVEDPGRVPDAMALGDGRFEVPPGANHGVRLMLVPPHRRGRAGSDGSSD